ncbi:MAG: VCBS repeat-containing protein [Cyclobacteriaceae bacterium]|nr:VCBS repeat-containing protein [Cyclobacteriaceae bacterium]
MYKINKTSFIVAFFFALAHTFSGCHKVPDANTLFTLMPNDYTNIHFNNQLKTYGKFNLIEYLYYYDGGGVAIGDINNDGLPDIFFTANELPNKLYLNKGDFQFDDITSTASVAGLKGWTTGVSMADVNGDGLIDIYVSQLGNYKEIKGVNQLYINNGDLTFTEKAKEYGLDFVGFSTQASFFDYDNDGDLDMYLLNHSVHRQSAYGFSTLRNEKDPLAGDRLYRNDSEGTKSKFTDVTAQAGIYSSYIGYGLGVTASDINKDGCIDIFISNDFHENDYLYINNCDGTFSEKIEQSLAHTSRSSMGNDLADFNNDGWLDLIIVDMLPEKEYILKKTAGEDAMDLANMKLNYGYHTQLTRNTLQLNNGNGTFSDIAQLSGIYATDWSWTPLFADLDNDGYKDLIVTNGIYKRPNNLDYARYLTTMKPFMNDTSMIDAVNQNLLDSMPSDHLPNYYYQNNGDLTFTDQAEKWGLGQPVFSNGAAYADLDNDGDLDIVLNNINQEAFIYRNNTETFNKNNYLRVKLAGTGKNTRGFGAKITLHVDGKIFYQEQMPIRGFQSSVDDVLHFGLGQYTSIDSLVVQWNNGKSQLIINPELNKLITLNGQEAEMKRKVQATVPTLFTTSDQLPAIDYQHHENSFDDFRYQRQIPHKLSEQGPKMAVGDVNNDGLEDFFVGGAKGQPGAVYFQNQHGQFTLSRQPALENDKNTEDVEAVFFLANADAYPDLYVVSGGNEWDPSGELLKDRLYLNDGKGLFIKMKAALPENMAANGSCVAPSDFDQDGDTDLFVGSRSVANDYTLTPESFLLENNGKGIFTIATRERAPGLAEVGMVTDALWTDTNQDGLPDLVVVGEWMPVSLFQNKDGHLTDVTAHTGLAKSNGWWNTVVAHDMDGDGDEDLIAGNLGLNAKIKASEKEPATLYMGDFDNNGYSDQILCFYKEHRNIPFITRDELLNQIPGLIGKYATYEDYSHVTSIKNILEPAQLSKATLREAHTFETAYIENLGDGQFQKRALPIEAQISAVFSILAQDYDGDGVKDLLLAGNRYASATNFGPYDASYGLLLKGDGQGDFIAITPLISGFSVKGQVRDLKQLTLADGRQLILSARNNDRLKIFELNKKTNEP